VYPTGRKSFTLVKRDAYKRQRWIALGATTELGIEEAREKARMVIARLKEGKEPFEAPQVKPESVADVVGQWIEQHVDRHKLRTAVEMKRVVRQHVLPVWGDRPFAQIKRADAKALLGGVASSNGDWTSDAVMRLLRAVASWYAKHGNGGDDYVNPFTGLDRRVPAADRTRDRILSDEELVALWHAAEQGGTTQGATTFGALVRVLLLTGQRLRKVSKMKWDDLNGNVWAIATEKREKGNAEVLRLPPQAMAIIEKQPRFASNPHVFPGVRAGAPVSGFAQLKLELDKRAGVKDYTLHDLRRTARSLMARAGVLSDHAERVLGHTVGNKVQQTYERYRYQAEMDAALVKLADLIDNIVNPPRPQLRVVAS
jgi:integrase